MNFEFHFARELKLLRITFRGDLDDSSLSLAIRRIRDLASQIEVEKALTDFSQVTSVKVASITVNSMAHQTPALPPPVLQVLLAPQDIMFGLARMFQSMGADQRPNMHVVRTLKDAYALLGIDKEPEYELLKVA